MRKSSALACVLGAAFICVVPVSMHWSPEKALSLSVDSASARVGRPLTPVSVAGVARRTVRRNVYHPYVYR
jgi:hypothetical protein